MRLFGFFIFVFIGGLFIYTGGRAGQERQTDPQTQRVLSRLATYEPHVNWDSRTMLKADFDHDGKNDYAFTGTQGGTYVVAIMRDSADGNPNHWIFRFSVVSPSLKINEICSLRTSIKTRSPVLLGSGKQMWRIPTNSKALLVDDGCDPVNITWDQEKRNFELLRIHVSM